MSNPPDLPELEELQPLEEGEVVSPAVAEQTLATLRSGLPPPAHNPRAEADYYRFLFASLMMFIGCMMPWSFNLDQAGYTTFVGGFITLYSIVLIWRWWAAIHTRKFAGKDLLWVVIALVPFGYMAFKLLNAFDADGIKAWYALRIDATEENPSWGGMFDKYGAKDGGMWVLSEFVRNFGPGRLLVFIASGLLELFMIMAIFGGAKKVKEQKAAARASASERKRR